MVALNFNAAGVKPNTALEAIPSGIYPVIITATSEKPTRNGQGAYIEVEMQIQGGEFNGRKVYDRLNIKNNNQQAVDIAHATLSAICHVTGVLQMTDTQQLHGRPFQAVVSKLERSDQPGSGNMTNEVKGYKDMNGNDPGFAGNTQGGGGQPGWAQQPQQGQAPVQQPVQQQAPVQQQQPHQGNAPSWAAQQPQGQAPAGNAAPSWAQQA